MEADYSVTEGDWDTLERYRGPSVFRAGLACARARRDLLGWMMGGVSNDAIRIFDLNGIDEDCDGLSDEAREFFYACICIGERRYASTFATKRRDAIRARYRAARLSRNG